MSELRDQEAPDPPATRRWLPRIGSRSPEAGKARGLAKALAGRQPPRLSGRNAYSLFVGFMKVLLPALAAALVLLVIAWPQIMLEDKRFRIGVADLSLDEAGSLSMLNARFEGVDELNRPYTLTADLAQQDSSDSDIVDLDLPKADMTLEDGTWLAITAKSGRYHRKAEYIELHGDVVLFHDKGFEVRTDSALIDLDKGTARGSTPVDGQGPLGLLNSEGFRLTEQGERIFFTGRSRMVVFRDTDRAGQ